MRSSTFALAFAAGALVMTRSTDARAVDPDPWLGRDKALHFSVSAALAAGGYAAGTALFEERWKALALGGSASIAAGAAKEGLDAAGFGDPSWRDFTWDVIGAAVGLGLAYAIDAAVSGGAPAVASPRGAAFALRF